MNLVASEGQVVVRLTTPSDGNEYDVSEAPDYTLSAQLQSATGTQEPVEFRACGEGCFVAALDWADGDNVMFQGRAGDRVVFDAGTMLRATG